ncbi:hypothetical protein TrRE_jg769 [Triparma retinervis]|uniref:Uncharacterized protein n=1 Tax=Triparma retinervis TaxID=2557542 RepID=A0A9W6ZF71_9STRA|nr:hypothetical protein TrRE_jg769 [Triparma retinervis]
MPSSSSEGGLKSSSSSVGRNSSFLNKEAVKDLKYRDEWEEDKQPCSDRELRAWYFYDFAHSGFPSAGNVLWVPIMLSIMARRHACPYQQEPKDELKPDPLFWSPYDGFKNASDDVCGYSGIQYQEGWKGLDTHAKAVLSYGDCTTCRIDTNGSVTGYGQWMERGNGYYGLTMYPAKTRKDEGTEDEDEIKAKIRMLIDLEYLDYATVDYANNLICEEYTGEGEIG